MCTEFVNVSPTASYGYVFDENDRTRTNTGDANSDSETEPVDDRPPLGKEFNSAKFYILSLQFNV